MTQCNKSFSIETRTSGEPAQRYKCMTFKGNTKFMNSITQFLQLTYKTFRRIKLLGVVYSTPALYSDSPVSNLGPENDYHD
jgi:hypothetical protein